MVTIEKASRGLSARVLENFVRKAQRAAGIAGTVEVLVTGNRRIQALNRTFRRKNKPTDVLAFPAATDGAGAVNGECAGGDIAISADIAVQNAALFGHSVAQEVKVLILHGMLHLAGYDHERDNGRMARREQRLRRQYRLPVTLTERGAHTSVPAKRRRRTS